MRRALEASRPRSAAALTPRTARRSPAHAAAVTNNEATFHFQKLLLHAAQLLLEAARGAAALPARAVNALHFVRVLLKFASEHLAVERLLQLVAEPPTAALGGASRAVQRARPPFAKRGWKPKTYGVFTRPHARHRRAARRRRAGTLCGDSVGVSGQRRREVRAPLLRTRRDICNTGVT